MRERVEDLGRVSEMLKNIITHELFDWKNNTRDKDAEEWFFSQPPDKQGEIIHELAYNISNVQELIEEAYEIARYGDQEG